MSQYFGRTGHGGTRRHCASPCSREVDGDSLSQSSHHPMRLHRTGMRITPPTAALIVLVSTLGFSAMAGGQPPQRTSGTLHTGALASPLSAVVCTSNQRCLAVGGQLSGNEGKAAIAAVTTDRGTHWSSTKPYGGGKVLDGLACQTVRTCIGVGWSTRSKPTSAFIYKAFVLQTLDAGRSWQVRSTLPGGVGMLSDVSCAPSFCMAVGGSPDNTTAVALITRSAGRRWTSLSLPKGEESLKLVTCTTAGNCIALGTREATTGDPSSGSLTSIIASASGGLSWSQRPLPTGAQPVVGIPYFTGMTCATRSHCLIVGEATPGDGNPSGLILSSADGGRTWRYDKVPSPTTILNAVACASSVQCVVMGGGFEPRGGPVRELLATTDHGQSWVSRTVPAAASALEGVSCPSKTVCVATGYGASSADQYAEQPVTIVTTDGGTTWNSSP